MLQQDPITPHLKRPTCDGAPLHTEVRAVTRPLCLSPAKRPFRPIRRVVSLLLLTLMCLHVFLSPVGSQSRDLGCLAAANMATFNWPDSQILAYRLTGLDYAHLKKSQTSKYRKLQSRWKQLGPANAPSLREKPQAEMLHEKSPSKLQNSCRAQLLQNSQALLRPC